MDCKICHEYKARRAKNGAEKTHRDIATKTQNRQIANVLIVFATRLTVSRFSFPRCDRCELKTINTNSIRFQLHNRRNGSIIRR